MKTYEVVCQYCNNKCVKINGSQLYNNRPDLKFKIFYKCFPCDAYVGTHVATGEPLGSVANSKLRSARMATHKLFDGFWKETGMKRYHAYADLADEMKITKDECHIGMFDVDQCKKVQSIVRGWYSQQLPLPMELQC